MEFIIRRAVAGDVPGIMAIMEEAKNSAEHPEWFVADDENFVRCHLSGKGFVIVAQTENKQIAGFFLVKEPGPEENLGVYLDYDSEKLKQVAVMDSAAVGTAYRGNGLQGRMLKAAEKELDTRKFKYLMCTIHPENIYSLQNMQRYGYEVKKTVLCYGGLPRHILSKELI